MEGEIALAPYIQLLLRRWPWILGAALLAALIAFTVTSLAPPTYEAVTLIALTEPSTIIQFDPRFTPVQERRPQEAYPELATSDEILQQLLREQNILEGVERASIEQLRRMVTAELGNDPSLLRLSVHSQDNNEAVQLANTWAELFVPWVNEIYQGQSTESVRFFESQLERAEQEIETAEEALIEFQTLDRTNVITNTLGFYAQEQVDYLGAQSMLAAIDQDVQNLHNQLLEQPDNSDVTFAEQLTALSLQLQAFNQQAAESATPLQLQINATETFASQSRRDQINFLQGLQGVLEGKAAYVETRLAEIEPAILELQREKQEVEAENNRLIRARDLAEETYVALAHKLDEERISSQDTNSGIRLASRAVVPVRLGGRRLSNTAIAGGLGFILAVFIVLAMEWKPKEEVLLQETEQQRPGRLNSALQD